MEKYIQTFSGMKFHFQKPDPKEVDIRDIAHALSLQCRYNGHIRKFYSVAEHCINVARLLPDELKLTGLLHDASEAYLSDIPSPVKACLPDYRALEARVEETICQAFGLTYPYPDEIHQADKACLIEEAHNLLTIDGPDHWVFNPDYRSIYDLKEKFIVGYEPKAIENLFMLYYNNFLQRKFKIAA